MKCPTCPFYERRTSYGFTTIRCGNTECEHHESRYGKSEELKVDIRLTERRNRMTLDEAIIHAEEVASKCEFETDWGMGNHFIDRTGVADVIECGKEHRQLAEWLKELKAIKQTDTAEKAKWIPGGDFPLRCSKCGRGSVQYENFCMTCGSDMR